MRLTSCSSPTRQAVLSSIDRPPFLAKDVAGPPKLPKRTLSPYLPSRANKEKTTQPHEDHGISGILDIALEPIEVVNGIVKEHVTLTKPLSNIVSLNQTRNGDDTVVDDAKEKDVTVVFAIRRAGCGSCRIHGLQVSELLKQDDRINLIGAIKETGVDDDALMDFYQKYFPFPLYKDRRWNLFQHAFGNRKVSIWRLLSSAPTLNKWYKERNVVNVPFGGDLFTKGGILIFDKLGQLKFVYYEKYGEELDMEAIKWAIHQTRQEAA